MSYRSHNASGNSHLFGNNHLQEIHQIEEVDDSVYELYYNTGGLVLVEDNIRLKKQLEELEELREFKRKITEAKDILVKLDVE